MATTAITLNIDNTLITEAVNALCSRGGYQSTLSDGSTNPQTKAQFAKQMLRDYVRNAVLEQRNITAQQATTAVDPSLIT